MLFRAATSRRPAQTRTSKRQPVLSAISNVSSLTRFVAFDELVESAVLLVLIEEGQIVLLKCSEPLVPGHALKRVFADDAVEVNPQHARVGVRAGAFYARWASAARFDPVADRIVIGGRLGTLRSPLC